MLTWRTNPQGTTTNQAPSREVSKPQDSNRTALLDELGQWSDIAARSG